MGLSGGYSWSDKDDYTSSLVSYYQSDFYFNTLTDVTATQMCSGANDFPTVAITGGSFINPTLYKDNHDSVSCPFTQFDVSGTGCTFSSNLLIYSID